MNTGKGSPWVGSPSRRRPSFGVSGLSLEQRIESSKIGRSISDPLPGKTRSRMYFILHESSGSLPRHAVHSFHAATGRSPSIPPTVDSSPSLATLLQGKRPFNLNIRQYAESILKNTSPSSLHKGSLSFGFERYVLETQSGVKLKSSLLINIWFAAKLTKSYEGFMLIMMHFRFLKPKGITNIIYIYISIDFLKIANIKSLLFLPP